MGQLLTNCTQMGKKALFYRVFTFPFNQGVRSSSLRWSTKIYPKITKTKWFWGIFLFIFNEIRSFLRFFQKILLACFGVFLFRLLANYSQIVVQKKRQAFLLVSFPLFISSFAIFVSFFTVFATCSIGTERNIYTSGLIHILRIIVVVRKRLSCGLLLCFGQFFVSFQHRLCPFCRECPPGSGV